MLVHTLGQAAQLDAAVLQLPGQRDRIRHGAAKPVEAPNNEGSVKNLGHGVADA